MRKFGDLALPQASHQRTPHVGRFSSLLRQHVATWVRTCADYYAAAAMHEQLSRLSDAELHRRGLSRERLGWEVCAACDHGNGEVDGLQSFV
jgi:hypothetical protein